jgi:hypothetical protein
MNPFARFEQRADFIKWLTLGAHKRWALLRDNGSIKWARVMVGYAGLTVRASGGNFYDNMGAMIPGPGEWHPDARVAAAMSARVFARQVRNWCRDL